MRLRSSVAQPPVDQQRESAGERNDQYRQQPRWPRREQYKPSFREDRTGIFEEKLKHSLWALKVKTVCLLRNFELLLHSNQLMRHAIKNVVKPHAEGHGREGLRII